jgi:transposase
MQRRSYPSDLTPAQWAIIEPLLPAEKPGGRPRSVPQREIVNAILYVDRTGCQWRALPHDFPLWTTVYSYFRIYRDDGTWRTVHDLIREQAREAEGKQATPSAAVMDSQSAKTVEKGGPTVTMRARRSTAASDIF